MSAGGLGWRMAGAALAAALAVSWPAGEAWSQGAWRPEKAVEIITSSAAGGSNDRIARLVQRIVHGQELLPVPVVVINKPGGNQVIAVNYLHQHPGDPHTLLLANPTVFGNQIAGLTPIGYTDLTPVALLLSEHTVFSVSDLSPIGSVKALFDRVRTDPESVTFGIVSLGGPNHLALSAAAKAAGIEPQKLKTVVFKTNAESMTAMVGGHIQAVASSVSSAIGQVRSGRARMIAIVAPHRLGGALAGVPTLREQGIESMVDSWRGVFGPKGMTTAHVAGWEDVLAAVVETEDWKRRLARYHWSGNFQRSREMTRYLDKAYADTRALMVELGLAK